MALTASAIGAKSRVPLALRRFFGGEVGGNAGAHLFARHRAAQVHQVDAALGRDGVAVALGGDEELAAVGVELPRVLGRDRADRVVVEEPRARAGFDVVEKRPPVAGLADDAEELRLAQELRQQVVLDVAGDAGLGACRRG